MGEPATCARDVLFYRWYAFLVRIIQLHKMQLSPYTDKEVVFFRKIYKHKLTKSSIFQLNSNTAWICWHYNKFVEH